MAAGAFSALSGRAQGLVIQVPIQPVAGPACCKGNLARGVRSVAGRPLRLSPPPVPRVLRPPAAPVIEKSSPGRDDLSRTSEPRPPAEAVPKPCVSGSKWDKVFGSHFPWILRWSLKEVFGTGLSSGTGAAGRRTGWHRLPWRPDGRYAPACRGSLPVAGRTSLWACRTSLRPPEPSSRPLGLFRR